VLSLNENGTGIMRYRLSAVAWVAALAVVQQAWALPPQKEAAPLSRILQALEQQDDVAYFKDIEWDETGYWEIEYLDKHGRTVELKIDPVSGETRRR
jgi:hypothetical protein